MRKEKDQRRKDQAAVPGDRMIFDPNCRGYMEQINPKTGVTDGGEKEDSFWGRSEKKQRN